MKTKYTKEKLSPIIADNFSWAGVLKTLGLNLTGGNYRNIQGHVKRLKLDVSHFTGRAWNRGLKAADHEGLKSMQLALRRPDEEVFIKDSPETVGYRLKERLVKMGWKEVCKICNISEWEGKKLVLHLDHINGDHVDNRLDNLRFLCPNCHAQVHTHREEV